MSSKSITGGTINFIKGETINLQNNQNSDKNNVVSKQQKELITNCDIKKGNLIIFSSYILLLEFYG